LTFRGAARGNKGWTEGRDFVPGKPEEDAKSDRLGKFAYAHKAGNTTGR